MTKQLRMEDVFGVGDISNYHEIVCKTGEEDICFLEDSEKAEAVAIALNNHDLMLDRITELESQNESLSEQVNCHTRTCNGYMIKVSDLQKQNERLIEALAALQDYTDKSPRDPDIYADQAEAWERVLDCKIPNLLEIIKGE